MGYYSNWDFWDIFIILLLVYNEAIQRPAASWRVGLIGRALHRYRTGQGFEPRYKPEFISGFPFATA